MKKVIEEGVILQNVQIGNDVWHMVVESPKQASSVRVGQFAQLQVSRTTAPLLRRPISYAGFNANEGTVEYIYRVVGEGSRLLTLLKQGDFLNTIGPIGMPFHPTDMMLLVGGGVGIAPLVSMVQHLEPHQKAVVILGFKDQSEVFWADLFKPYGVDVYITTNDGSAGYKGFPTNIMEEVLKKHPFTSVHTCGPMLMMKAVADIAKEADVLCEVSLESRMGCGTGGCFGCGMDAKGGKRVKVCTHGPVFPAGEVFF